jgi:hypothetical protein
MSRRPQFFIKFLAVALCISAALQVMASLPDQPAPAPARAPASASITRFDFSAFCVNDSLVGFNDSKRAFTYDNFTLTDRYELDAICWTGNCAAKFPSSPASDTDFLIRIFTDDLGAPDLSAIAARLSNPPDLNVASLDYSAHVTATDLVGGGAAFTFDAPL